MSMLILIFSIDIMTEIALYHFERKNQMKDLAQRKDIYDEIIKLFQTVSPLLEEAGIPAERYRVQPFERRRYSVTKLNDIFKQLRTFVDGDEIRIFVAARALQPPGCLRAWADDELMCQAREVLVYKSAAKLLRDTWYGSGSMKLFFFEKKPS